MLSSKERVIYLLRVWSSGKANADEIQELFDVVQKDDYYQVVKNHIEQLIENDNDHEPSPSVEWEKVYTQILERRQPLTASQVVTRQLAWYRWAAAASIIVMLALAGYWLIPGNVASKNLIEQKVDPVKNDFSAPASSKATLTLADGRVIDLDSVKNGSLSFAGVANASKLNDGLHYVDNNTEVTEWHTLSNPKGSKPIHLQLSDGSEIWLNAASSATFPTVFVDVDRIITITGEAYFEVQKKSGRKFLVSANGSTTEVLGTHFNINAYENESDVRITLLEGSINTVKSGESAILVPGQQAKFSNDGRLKVSQNVNIDEVMAWKDNMFEFNGTDIQTIMRQVERWYDVEVVFDENVSLKFNGSIQRQVNVSRLLDMLQKTGGINFIIENKKIVVKK